MKQVRILANFAVGNELDEELLLESIEAAIRDVLFDVDDQWMRINWDDIVQSVEVSIIGNWR